MKYLQRAALAAALSTTTAIAWQTTAFADGPETRAETRPNRTLIGSGIVTLGLTYGTSVIVGAQSDHDGDKQLFIPVAGPWLDLTSRGGCPVDTGCGTETAYKALLVGDGILQALGALDIVAGFVMPETVTTSAKVSTDRSVAVFRPTLRFSPTTVAGGYGVAAVGTF